MVCMLCLTWQRADWKCDEINTASVYAGQFTVVGVILSGVIFRFGEL